MSNDHIILERHIDDLFQRAQDDGTLVEMGIRPETIVAIKTAVKRAAPAFSSIQDCFKELENCISVLGAIAASSERGEERNVGISKRKQMIDREINRFCKQAGEEQLDKPMRDEGVKALKIAANKFAYKKKYYDSENDQIIVYPSVRTCLAGYDIYEEAEKYYYDPGDDYPLKYIAALRDISLAEGGGDENLEYMDKMAMECSSEDDFFCGESKNLEPSTEMAQETPAPETTRAEPVFRSVLGSSKRQRLIESQIDHFCKRAGEEELDKPMRDEGVKALKIAANKFAYKKKYYDAGTDQIIVFPSVRTCLAGYDIYEEAEKYYYDPGDDYPLKYIAALREIALAEGGGDDNTEHMDKMAMECSSDDEFFCKSLKISLP